MRVSSLIRLAALVGLLAAGTSVQAATLLGSVGVGSVGLVVDGTSNTVAFGEGARGTFCFRNADVTAGIVDGVSNTIAFGERGGLAVIPGRTLDWAPVSTIVDGTSNTILIGEIGGAFCIDDTRIGEPVAASDIVDGASNTILIGETTIIDLCISAARQTISDGTSNTILIGELGTACYQGVAVSPDISVVLPDAPTPVPAPPALWAMLAGLAILGSYRQRRLCAWRPVALHR